MNPDLQRRTVRWLAESGEGGGWECCLYPRDNPNERPNDLKWQGIHDSDH